MSLYVGAKNNLGIARQTRVPSNHMCSLAVSRCAVHVFCRGALCTLDLTPAIGKTWGLMSMFYAQAHPSFVIALHAIAGCGQVNEVEAPGLMVVASELVAATS